MRAVHTLLAVVTQALLISLSTSLRTRSNLRRQLVSALDRLRTSTVLELVIYLYGVLLTSGRLLSRRSRSFRAKSPKSTRSRRRLRRDIRASKLTTKAIRISGTGSRGTTALGRSL